MFDLDLSRRAINIEPIESGTTHQRIQTPSRAMVPAHHLKSTQGMEASQFLNDHYRDLQSRHQIWEEEQSGLSLQNHQHQSAEPKNKLSSTWPVTTDLHLRSHPNQYQPMDQNLEDPIPEYSPEELVHTLQKVKDEMTVMEISQKIFARAALNRTRGILGQMLKHNGVGYERHIAAIKRFLEMPLTKRKQIYHETSLHIRSEECNT